MTDSAEPGWVNLARFGARPEADMLVGRLQETGIPTLVKGPETGIFGPGFAGTTPQGVTVLVPADRVAEARQMLE